MFLIIFSPLSFHPTHYCTSVTSYCIMHNMHTYYHDIQNSDNCMLGKTFSKCLFFNIFLLHFLHFNECTKCLKRIIFSCSSHSWTNRPMLPWPLWTIQWMQTWNQWQISKTSMLMSERILWSSSKLQTRVFAEFRVSPHQGLCPAEMCWSLPRNMWSQCRMQSCQPQPYLLLSQRLQWRSILQL